MADKSDSTSSTTDNEPVEVALMTKRTQALRSIVLRQRLRAWASKSAQERNELADDIQQLFSSPSALNSGSTNGSMTTPATNSAITPARAVTRRPGVEEVKNCMLSSVYAALPPQCSALRGEIWQVLLNVYKRNQHGASAQEFDRMMMRLGKLPRDPLLVEECAQVSVLLAGASSSTAATSALLSSLEEEQARIQKELEILLVWFLTTKSVAYTSGMARVVAPFFLLSLPLPTIYDCFYQYCANFLPHLINSDSVFDQSEISELSTENVNSEADTGAGLSGDDEDKAKGKASESSSSETETERQQLVEQLLSYHDPQLAHFLAQWCGNEWSQPGQVIPSSFFMGDLYQTISPKMYTYVMDQILLTGDTLFGVFVLLAALIHQKDTLMVCTSAAEVKAKIQEVIGAAFENDENVQFLCLFASRLRTRTPKSYKCNLREGGPETQSPSRLATDIAFGITAASKASSNNVPPTSEKRDVDMTEWVKKESRSIAGKIFWYHTQTGKTQWEHPAEKHDPAPALFALPISVDEVGGQVMGEKTSESSNGLHFFVVDCRGLRSSEDLKSGRIPAAYTLDPSVFDNPDLIAKNMEALNPLKSQVHIVLVGHGVGVPPELATTDELKTSVRDAVRHDADSINRAAIFFQKRGFRFVSSLDGGYSSWHAYMRDNASCSPQELLNHVENECHYCRYDTILRTGEDPFKKKATQQKMFRRRKSAMPTTTNLPVNGGEGDASIISTSSLNNNNISSSGSSSNIGSGNRLSMTSLSRTSISNMRTKFADVKMPKLQWGRRSSATSTASNTNNHNDSGSSSETATVDDGGSDRGSSATDDLEEKPDEVDENLEALQAKLEAQVSPKERKKSFVGVFTIDYSDDEEEDHETTIAAAESNSEVAAAAAVSMVVAPTQTA